jgi:hypothetical protein
MKMADVLRQLADKLDGIGSLQIYNGALTDAEMLSNYNTTKSYYGL